MGVMFSVGARYVELRRLGFSHGGCCGGYGIPALCGDDSGGGRPGDYDGFDVEAGGGFDGGDYSLAMTYLEAVDGQDRTYRSLGTWSVEQGIPADSAAVYYRLVEASPWADTLNFLYLGDSVMLLGTDLSKPMSKLNYSLVQVGE